MSPTLTLLHEAERAAALTAETLDTAANGSPQLAHVLRAHAAQARVFVYAVRGLRLTLLDPVSAVRARPETEAVLDERETTAGHALVWAMNAHGWLVSTPAAGHAAGYTATRTADGALVYALTLDGLARLVHDTPAPAGATCAEDGCDDPPRLGSRWCCGHHAEHATRAVDEVSRG